MKYWWVNEPDKVLVIQKVDDEITIRWSFYKGGNGGGTVKWTKKEWDSINANLIPYKKPLGLNDINPNHERLCPVCVGSYFEYSYKLSDNMLSWRPCSRCNVTGKITITSNNHDRIKINRRSLLHPYVPSEES